MVPGFREAKPGETRASAQVRCFLLRCYLKPSSELDQAWPEEGSERTPVFGLPIPSQTEVGNRRSHRSHSVVETRSWLGWWDGDRPR
jgi:hypothetical protein